RLHAGADSPPEAQVAPGVLFFFQAEDGIRAGHVTGVQTCALPISGTKTVGSSGCACWGLSPRRESPAAARITASQGPPSSFLTRSEERRVGKECRSRRAPYH